jgi:YebC/PmpR family DNA-binding regulatory protein
MAGHSHWAGIKHKKALIDSKRGKAWSKVSKQLIVAAKLGGGDPNANVRLRTAIADAKAVNLPKETIEHAIKKGTGELEGGNVEEILYEGYGPAGVAVMCEIMTDNRNRTAPEIRKLFDLHGGKLGATNCVAWMFDRKGLFLFDGQQVDGEKLMEIALEAGADDVKNDGGKWVVTCDPDSYSQVEQSFESTGLQPESKQLTRVPQNTVDLGPEDARKVLRLVEALDEHDDVQSVSANFNIPDDVMAEIES